MAARLSMVSSSDSPFEVEEAAMFRLMTSADRRLEAISKVVRVRVEFSKNEDVVDDGLRQAFDGQQVLQLAVAVQLRVMHCRLRS
jgi:hypothetical protein